MRLDRQLARILGAAIVMIVAYLAPCPVQAHAGHPHPARPTVTSTDVVSAGSHETGATAVGAKADAVTAAAGAGAKAPTELCTGPCCCSGAGMMACCAHALAPDAGLPPRPTATCPTASPDFLARLGTDPEALPKPPRTFA